MIQMVRISYSTMLIQSQSFSVPLGMDHNNKQHFGSFDLHSSHRMEKTNVRPYVFAFYFTILDKRSHTGCQIVTFIKYPVAGSSQGPFDIKLSAATNRPTAADTPFKCVGF